MIRYELDAADISAIRFGISPLSELGLGLRALSQPDGFPLQRPWLERIASVRPLLDLEVLLALVNDRKWTADFVNPRPASPLTSLDDELTAARTDHPRPLHDRPRARARGGARGVPGPTRPGHRPPATRPRHHVGSVLRPALGAHEHRAARRQSRYRGRIAAQAGMGTVLNGLSDAPPLRRPPTRRAAVEPEIRRRPVRGDGLTLVPSIFTVRVSTPIDDDLPPTVMYPARGQGAMWSTSRQPAPDAVSDLSADTRHPARGPGRAGILHTISPCVSGVSTSAINRTCA